MHLSSTTSLLLDPCTSISFAWRTKVASQDSTRYDIDVHNSVLPGCTVMGQCLDHGCPGSLYSVSNKWALLLAGYSIY